jgi:hypothetical protein
MDNRSYGPFFSLALKCLTLQNNLTLGYTKAVNQASKAARELARLSVLARRQKWGDKGLRERMRVWGKLGGRPRGKKGNQDGK